MEFNPVVITDEEVSGEVRMMKSHPYTPRAWQWLGVKQAANKALVNVINRRRTLAFVLQPHSYWNYSARTL